MFMVFEGGDGCGKTSAIEYIKSKLDAKNKDLSIVLNDWYGDYGRRCKHTITSHPNLADVTRLQLVENCRSQSIKNVNQQLSDGKVVLYDRFILSTYAYQSSLGIGTLTPTQVTKFADKDVRSLKETPVYVILKGVDYDTQQERIKARNSSVTDVFDFMGRDKYEKIQNFYENAVQLLMMFHHTPKVIFIDNSRDVEYLHTQLDRIVDLILQQSE